MTTTADQLATEFRLRGYRADVLHAEDDPANLAVDVARIWHEPYDRYPAACVLAPTGVDDDGWAWGGNFEFDADAEIQVAELADKVIESIGVQ